MSAFAGVEGKVSFHGGAGVWFRKVYIDNAFGCVGEGNVDDD